MYGNHGTLVEIQLSALLISQPFFIVYSQWHRDHLRYGYCKFGNFREGFSFVKIKSSQNGKITLSITDIVKSCPLWERSGSVVEFMT